jgi:hypothetical protein
MESSFAYLEIQPHESSASRFSLTASRLSLTPPREAKAFPASQAGLFPRRGKPSCEAGRMPHLDSEPRESIPTREA